MQIGIPPGKPDITRQGIWYLEPGERLGMASEDGETPPDSEHQRDAGRDRFDWHQIVGIKETIPAKARRPFLS